MSQNVPKKIQVEERRKKVSELYLKNMSITRISELFGVDRKTIQRDLKQVKFSFIQSRPSEEMYLFAVTTLLEHKALYQNTQDLLKQATKHEEAVEYLRILNKMWATKAHFLAKTGLFDALPSMIDENHDIGKHIYLSLKDWEKKQKREEEQ